VSILPGKGETRAQVLECAAQFPGTALIYEDIFLGRRTLNEVVITEQLPHISGTSA
jgi:hypothetical protein